ncbi:terminase large subunit [Streptomyces sp. AC495_CC817]|uniref:terminase large subunit n=1 Tax=Streptomyces sp. AC495_CC817 TaxID=2823900 RepID=UPI001C2724A8|nr:terminase large subunit [Streptomyces sp. AC495_CC817]
MPFEFDPAPKFMPERDLSWNTEGGEIAKVARLMGFELMPWQRRVVDRATEWRTFAPGESKDDKFLGQRRYRYSRVVVTVPRQSGKTTLMGPVRIHRMMTRPNLSAWSTAQTGNDAGKRMKDLITLIAASPLAPMFKSRLSNGSEGLVLPANGSRLTRFAPRPDAIHGETPQWADYDEFWKYSRELGEQLMGAISPAMITLYGIAQRWFVSTMGTAQSGFMNDIIEEGRSGRTPDLFYAEYSMPDGLDPYDPETWWTFHPALGNTQTVDALQAETGMPYGEWMRGFMNRRTESVDAIVEAAEWDKLRATWVDPPAWSDVAIAYEVAQGGDSAAIYAVWRDEHGNPCTHVVHAAPGTIWLADLVERIKTECRPMVVAADDGGETRAVTDELTRRGLEVYTTGARDFGTACIALLAAARDEKTLRHDGSQTLRLAVMHAVLRSAGDAPARFSRKYSTGPVAALIAVAVGLWAYDHRDAPMGAPVLR